MYGHTNLGYRLLLWERAAIPREAPAHTIEAPLEC